MQQQILMWTMALCVSLSWLASWESTAVVAAGPNILWITLEDMSPDLGCYGDDYAVMSWFTGNWNSQQLDLASLGTHPA